MEWIQTQRAGLTLLRLDAVTSCEWDRDSTVRSIVINVDQIVAVLPLQQEKSTKIVLSAFEVERFPVASDTERSASRPMYLYIERPFEQVVEFLSK